MATEYKVVSGSCGLTCSIMFNSVTPWMVALQAPLSMEYWNGLTFPTPGSSSYYPPYWGLPKWLSGTESACQ